MGRVQQNVVGLAVVLVGICGCMPKPKPISQREAAIEFFRKKYGGRFHESGDGKASSLDLSGRPVTPEMLTELPSLENLSTLNLAYTWLSDEMVELLSGPRQQNLWVN